MLGNVYQSDLFPGKMLRRAFLEKKAVFNVKKAKESIKNVVAQYCEYGIRSIQTTEEQNKFMVVPLLGKEFYVTIDNDYVVGTRVENKEGTSLPLTMLDKYQELQMRGDPVGYGIFIIDKGGHQEYIGNNRKLAKRLAKRFDVHQVYANTKEYKGKAYVFSGRYDMIKNFIKKAKEDVPPEFTEITQRPPKYEPKFKEISQENIALIEEVVAKYKATVQDLEAIKREVAAISQEAEEKKEELKKERGYGFLLDVRDIETPAKLMELGEFADNEAVKINNALDVLAYVKRDWPKTLTSKDYENLLRKVLVKHPDIQEDYNSMKNGLVRYRRALRLYPNKEVAVKAISIKEIWDKIRGFFLDLMHAANKFFNGVMGVRRDLEKLSEVVIAKRTASLKRKFFIPMIKEDVLSDEHVLRRL